MHKYKYTRSSENVNCHNNYGKYISRRSQKKIGRKEEMHWEKALNVQGMSGVSVETGKCYTEMAESKNKSSQNCNGIYGCT